ncbi:MAG: peroxiredoxin [Nostocoides sp.]
MTSTSAADAFRSVEVGDTAPEFTLPDQNRTPYALSSYRGKQAVLLVFYPFAFSGICTGELTEIRDDLGAFVSDAVQVLTISCDPVYSLRAWADHEAFFFPLLSDFWPHGQVARSYGVFDEGHGMAVRGTFLIDADGVVRWSLVKGPGERRDFSGYRQALAAL